MGAIEYRIKQKNQNLLNYGDISLIESRISTIFLLNTEFGTPPPSPPIMTTKPYYPPVRICLMGVQLI